MWYRSEERTPKKKKKRIEKEEQGRRWKQFELKLRIRFRMCLSLSLSLSPAQFKFLGFILLFAQETHNPTNRTTKRQRIHGKFFPKRLGEVTNCTITDRSFCSVTQGTDTPLSFRCRTIETMQ